MAETQQWMRTVWPVVTETHLTLPMPLTGVLRECADACGGDPTGPDALGALL